MKPLNDVINWHYIIIRYYGFALIYITQDMDITVSQVNMSPNMVWDDRRPNMKRTVVQILHSVFSASGIGTNYDKPRSLW